MSDPKRTPEDERDEMAAFPSASDKMFEITPVEPTLPTPFENGQAWYFYVNGYKDAADLLVTHLGEGDSRKLGYPIVYLYRQHLELALKSLIRECRRVLGWDEAFPKTHRIDELWKLCIDLLNEITPATLENDEIKHTTRLISEFCTVDPKSEAFRYPETKGRTFEVHTTLTEMKDVVGKISLLLDCIDTHISTQNKDAF